MANPNNPVKLAAVQAAPIFLDRQATVEKACRLIREAGDNGADLVAFPESFIPAYPDWVWAIPPGEAGLLSELYAEFVANSVDIPSPYTQRLCQAAEQAGVFVVMGLTERNYEASGATLYNTLLYIDDQGRILGKHRKLVPTGGERLVWGQGDGSTLDVYPTRIGVIGGLICWENYMPLARYAMYARGVQIYVASTWDQGEPWLSTLRHIAKEGRTVVVGTCMVLRLDDIPDRLSIKEKYYAESDGQINAGDSAIAGPNGKFMAGPLHGEEGILYAEVDMQRIRGPKWMLDVAGHYARPDVFQLTVNRTPRPMLNFQEETANETDRQKID